VAFNLGAVDGLAMTYWRGGLIWRDRHDLLATQTLGSMDFAGMGVACVMAVVYCCLQKSV